jgi:tRNA(His) guanylyltransferase
MQFDDLDRVMRAFETAHDRSVPPDVWMAARIDGRNFTRLTKETLDFEAPFDVWMRDTMMKTTVHLMQCGFRVIYGYTQSDEISLLFAHDETAFDRKTRKYDSILAGEASAAFSLLLGHHATFDCRISELPNEERVCDYFRWRSEDANRNALTGWCYWTLRREGQKAGEAANILHRLSMDDKTELLAQRGIDFAELPSWQKRGSGLFWETYEKPAVNPITGKALTATRRRIVTNLELPQKEEYGAFLRQLLR